VARGDHIGRFLKRWVRKKELFANDPVVRNDLLAVR